MATIAEQTAEEESHGHYAVDMSHIKGQEHVKRALEVAASGGHNCLMSGSPGAGKTLLARCMPTILPSMSNDEMLEVTNILWSICSQRSLYINSDKRTYQIGGRQRPNSLTRYRRDCTWH